ncbi:MAG: oxygen-independent coproporphyrinogen III oxidase [Rhodobacterales bacterium]|nr:MAG: oxygen-independent coproporphyrinogen III oxidase [Rhodobacterales bacterium]
MTSRAKLRDLGLFDARAPRYTSYPPANHFSDLAADSTETWIRALPSGARVSLYLHVPYCRRLCWFCACRTQGTSTDRPLVPYVDMLKRELEIVDGMLGKDVVLSRIHFGGGTPTILPPELIAELGGMLDGFRDRSDDFEFSVEIDPTEVDQARIDAFAALGMSRASIGVQDFDPIVQESIGRLQSFEQTRDVVERLRAAGVGSLNMDILYGLPHQTRARMAASVEKVLELAPDRVALYGYAHVPWMAKRQVMIPADALPDAEERLDLFEAARKLFLWRDYAEIGIDHFARKSDSMAHAADDGTLARNFQGYTVDPSDALIGLGASAISRYPQGFAQNHSTSSKYTGAVQDGRLATVRGHAMSDDDLLRSDLIEDLMCRFAIDLNARAAQHGRPLAELEEMCASIHADFEGWVEQDGPLLRITREPHLIARLVAQKLDAYLMPEGRHSKAL